MNYLENDARISDCQRYRYLLRRTWNHARPRYLFVMLNPSTADGEQDDATIRSVVRITDSLGGGSFEVVNLFAWRATDPKDLLEVNDPIGPLNDKVIMAALRRCDIPIVAWGAHAMAVERGARVKQELRLERPAVFCLGKNKAGAPKHPLYLKSITSLEKYGS